MDTKFANQTAVVVGGSSGIGLAVARAAHLAGAAVVLVGRSSEKLRHASETIGPGVRTLRADVTNEASVQAAFETIASFDKALAA